MAPEQIQAGARTVAHMATYFEELKNAARGLLTQNSARQRGYFTPSEDEAVRRLLVSYWQSRNALLDLVISYRDDASLPHELRPMAFLVAYAAAVLLVDAARFLREAFDDEPIVRSKLNEPEPHFGIPPGTYDAVQHSLTSTRHAWHLYHAMSYFDAHEGELRALAAEGYLAPSLAVIDRLGERVRVPASRYLQARLRVRADQALRGLHERLLARALYGLQKAMGCLASGICVRPGHQPCLPPKVGQQVRALAKPGDIFITRKEYAVTNYFLPGYWPHAALFLGDAAGLARLGIESHDNVRPRWDRLLSAGSEEPRCVLEALKDGVWIRPASSPLSCDSLIVLRPRLRPDDIGAALARGLFHEGKPYDFDFDFTRSDRLVCTEVVYRSYEGIGGVQFQLTRRAGRLTLAAEDLARMALDAQYFTVAAVYAPRQSARLLEGADAARAVKRQLADSD